MSRIERSAEKYSRADHCEEIRQCRHVNTRAFGGMGHAMCDDCGAILPDEDPDIRTKG